MSFPKYPEYKDSGVPWVGHLPHHWDILPLKRDLAFLTSGSRGWADHYADDGAIFLRIGNLTRDQISLDLSDIQRVSVPDGSEGERTKVIAGDILFSITAFLGSVAVVPDGLETSYVSQHVALARIHQRRLLPTWCAYVTLSCIGKIYLETQGYGGTKIQLSLSDVANLVLPTPPLSEQVLIATFLDRETAKIDALVAEQEKLIELLKEKRQAVISHAVTKGLDPNVPMKDSGVEWLGEVPSHWEIKRIKHLGEAFNGLTYNPSEISDDSTGTLVLRSSNVQNGIISLEDNVYVTANIPEKLRVKTGDILICSRNGSRALIGKNAIINEDVSGSTFGVFMMVFRSKIYRYIRYILNSELFTFQSSAFLTSTINQLTVQNFNGFEVPVPPSNEQSTIATFLDYETERIDALVTEAQRAIDLLKERRAALISAAVTGKIDVRGQAEATQ